MGRRNRNAWRDDTQRVKGKQAGADAEVVRLQARQQQRRERKRRRAA